MAIELSRVDEFALIRINRPEALNALSFSLIEDLGRKIDEAEAAKARALLITGAGEKAFCAGADIAELVGRPLAETRRGAERGQAVFAKLERLPMPSVALVNGYAFGGGLELALVCDLRVAAAHVKVGLPETTLGIIPGAGGTQRVGRIVGEARAKEMILLGRRLSAQEALAWGLVNRVTPEGKNVVDDAVEWIEPIANGAPIAQAAALEAIDRSFEVGLELGLELEKVSYDKVLVSADRREALAAFAEKRKPVFSGK